MQRKIRDTDAGGFKEVDSLVFQVDLLDGNPVFKTFSVLSSKLANQLEPFIANFRFLEYEFTITKEGEGMLTEYRVAPVKLAPEAPEGP